MLGRDIGSLSDFLSVDQRVIFRYVKIEVCILDVPDRNPAESTDVLLDFDDTSVAARRSRGVRGTDTTADSERRLNVELHVLLVSSRWICVSVEIDRPASVPVAQP